VGEISTFSLLLPYFIASASLNFVPYFDGSIITSSSLWCFFPFFNPLLPTDMFPSPFIPIPVSYPFPSPPHAKV
jgi:hypothetical protein